MVLLPWDFGSDMNPFRSFMRGTSFSVTIVQMVVAAIAFRDGFRLIPAIIALPTSIKIGMVIFWVTFLLSTWTVAAKPAFALLGITQLCVHLLFALSIIYLISMRDDLVARDFWRASGLGVVGYALLWIANIVFYDPQGEDWMNFVPALTNIRWIGFFALTSFCSGLGMLATSDDRTIRHNGVKLGILFCSLGCFLALWTASRGAMLAICVAAAIVMLLAKDRKAIAATLLISVILAVAVIAVLPVPHPSYGLGRFAGSIAQSQDLNQLSSIRLELWIQTFEKILIRPWLGWGIDQFRFSGPETTLGFRHPHQSILQLLFATGIAGAFGLALILIPLIRQFPSVARLSVPSHWAAISYLAAGMIYGLHDGFFYYCYPVMIYLVSMAVLVKRASQPHAIGR